MRSAAGEHSDRPEAKGRTRVVTFRVSIEEFGLLTRARILSDSRSLSSFARRAVLDKVKSIEEPSRTLTGDLSTIAKTLAELDAALNEISKRIRSVLGLPQPDGRGPGSDPLPPDRSE